MLLTITFYNIITLIIVISIGFIIAGIYADAIDNKKRANKQIK